MAAEEHGNQPREAQRTDEVLRRENEALRRQIAELEALRTKCALHQGVEARMCARGRREGCECPLQEMADNIRDVFWVFDWQAQRVIYTSPAYEEIWGRSVRALYDRYEEWSESVHPEDRDFAERSFARAVETDGGEPREYRIVRPDSSVRWVSDRAYPIRDEKGQVHRVVGIAEDITIHKRAEEALRESEEKFRNLAEQSPNMIFINQAGRVVYVNPKCEACMGYTKEEFCAADFDFLKLIAPEHRDRIMENFRCHMAGEEVPAMEYALHTKGGRRIEAILATRLIQYEGQTAILGTVADITRYKQAEEELQRINDELERRVKERTAELEAEVDRRHRVELGLRESEEKYRTLVENSGHAIAAIDEAGAYLFVNQTTGDYFALDAQEMVGRTVWDFFPQEVADEHMDHIRSVIRSGIGSTRTAPSQIVGQPRWFSATVEPLQIDGKIEAAMVIARDVTDLVQAWKQLEAYREQMTRADRLASLGTMSAMVAHELTQPLTVLRLSIENALEAVKTDGGGSVVADDLGQTMDEIVTMTEIIERFRGFARASSPGHQCDVTFPEIAGHVVKLTAETAEQARVSVTVSGLGELPRFSARPKDMEQLFFALIMNAIQAADGQADRTVTVTGETRDHAIELCFEDTCGGLAEDDVDQIFKPFFTTKGAAGGTGLGLCVVEHILDRYGGKIQLLNRPGEGVTFTVTLPLPTAS